MRANISLIRQGYEVTGTDLDADTAAALDAVAEITADPDLWAELPIGRGQLQFLNNREVAHYRYHFTDDDDPEMRRHLVRTWQPGLGTPSYDG